MKSQNEITIDQIKYIASVAKCPKCGSKDVKFDIPFESRLETKDGKLNSVVMDFSNPSYFLTNTHTTCLKCSFKFHLHEHDDQFYQGLEKSFKDKKEDVSVFYYEFDSYKTD